MNPKKITETQIKIYQEDLLHSCPKHIVIDNLFHSENLDKILHALEQPHHWKTQQHTYSALYVDKKEWQNTRQEQRFVQRDIWQRYDNNTQTTQKNNNEKIACEFLSFLRSKEFMSVLSDIFEKKLTDIHVENPKLNTNYFRLNSEDFVEQHADDSPGREVCMLLYLNKHWRKNAGGELAFKGKENKPPIIIPPLYNRCVFFNPSSEGSEHWVKKLNLKNIEGYRYNITSWYWTE